MDEMGRQYWEGYKRTDGTSGTRTSGGGHRGQGMT